VTQWQAPPESFELGAAQLHVFRADLDRAEPVLGRLESWLSEDEIARADRFALPKVRKRFVAGRGLLRVVLARYLETDPSTLAFCYGPQGKPALEGPRQPLSFNLSHSAHMVVCAVSRSGELGIDVEHVRPAVDSEAIARRFFSPRETAALLALPPAARPEAFFACWTRKEAYLKAKGGGLTIPLASFDVSLAPGEPVALLRAADPDETRRWALHALAPAKDFVAALAVDRHVEELRLFSWPCLTS
jgi:4'-phosphopantetheinyl transferase